MTQLEAARKGIITQQMNEVAEDEGLPPEEIRGLVATGEVVIPHNVHHNFRAIGIGKNLRTKVNANIGASNFHQLIEEEVEKLYTAVRFGSDKRGLHRYTQHYERHFRPLRDRPLRILELGIGGYGADSGGAQLRDGDEHDLAPPARERRQALCER